MKKSNKPRHQPKSIFAVALQSLLDDTNYYSRTEWAKFLGISTPAISQWVNDKTLPRPDLIRMILDVLGATENKNTTIIVSNFQDLMDEPSENISPLGARLGFSLKDYLKAGSFVRFGRQLRGLTPEEQISLIRSEIGSEDQAEKLVKIKNEKSASKRILSREIASDISSLLDEATRVAERKELQVLNRLAFRKRLVQAGVEIEKSSSRRVPVLPVRRERLLESV